MRAHLFSGDHYPAPSARWVRLCLCAGDKWPVWLIGASVRARVYEAVA